MYIRKYVTPPGGGRGGGYLEVWHFLHGLSDLCHHKHHRVLHLLQGGLKHQDALSQAELHLEEGERRGSPFSDLVHKDINGASEKTPKQVAYQSAGAVEEASLLVGREVPHQVFVREHVENLGEPAAGRAGWRRGQARCRAYVGY